MNIHFFIDYYTVFGEELVLNLLGQDANGDRKVSKYRMKAEGEGRWKCDIRHEFQSGSFIDYYYAVEREGKEERHEWLVAMHRLEFDSVKGINYNVYDHWIDAPEDIFTARPLPTA